MDAVLLCGEDRSGVLGTEHVELAVIPGKFTPAARASDRSEANGFELAAADLERRPGPPPAAGHRASKKRLDASQLSSLCRLEFSPFVMGDLDIIEACPELLAIDREHEFPRL